MMRISLSLGIFLTLFFPEWKLSAFTPFLTLVVLQKTPLFSLFVASVIGLFLDLLSDEWFGLSTACFTGGALALILLSQHIFTDRKEILPLFGFFFSFVQTLLTLLLLKSPLSYSLGVELLGMPLLDAFYTFLLLLAPPLLFKKYSLLRKAV